MKCRWLLAGMVVAFLSTNGILIQTLVRADETPETREVMVHARALSKAFRHASEVATPSVVTVRSKAKAKSVNNKSLPKGQNPFKGTPFEDFFDDYNDKLGGFSHPQIPPREGAGSGVIIDKSGLVLTNNHVVEGADEITVQLADGREFKGEDIKTDDQTDLAIVRLKNASNLPQAKLGDSDSLEIGDWVIAIGNPFELEQTVSAGIISGKGRDLGSVRRAKFLQTDAAINPGNSGGPLVNLEGEIVGINTAIATNTGTFNGIGFAIPINLAKWVVPQLIKEGKVQRAYLGVAISEINNDLADKFNVNRNSGVLVTEVFPNSPAAEAGLKEGDVIQKFEGTSVHNPRELQELVERTTLGSKHKLEVQREGKPETLEVVSKSLPKDFGTLARSNSPEKSETPEVQTFEDSDLGLTVTDITPEQADQLGYKGMSGVLISSVEPGSVAYSKGLRSGMLVMKVGKKDVKSLADYEAAVKQESLDNGILMLVRTRAGNRYVVLGKE